ncbi:MAG: hypothetical protein ACLPY1_15065 [Terracidiphilus sp.]
MDTLRQAWLLVFCLLAAIPIHAQDAAVAQPGAQPGPQPITQPLAVAPNLFRIEGVDPADGHYIRLILLQTAYTPPAAFPPWLAFECVEKDAKRDLRLFVSFGGISDMSFIPAFHPTPTSPFEPNATNVNLKMNFVGYIKWKPYVESWRLVPNGELRYRNTGFSSPNMESVQFILKMLNSLPGLHIVHESHVANDPGEVFFQTQPLLDELKKTPMCNP